MTGSAVDPVIDCQIEERCSTSAFGVRRDKAALFQWVQAPPGERSSRKQPEQSWR